jgi:hypothetical protein
MKPMPAQAEVNRFVIDYLRHGPAELETLYSAAFKWMRVPRGMVDGAMMQYRVKRLKNADDGTRYVTLPDNLLAIWWARRARPQPCGLQNSGGNAA